MWLCMKWRDMVHGCMAYTERTEMAAVSRGTSYVTTKRCCKYTTSVYIQKSAMIIKLKREKEKKLFM